MVYLDVDGEALGFSLVALAVIMWSAAPSLASRASFKKRGLFDAKVFNAWRVLFSLIATSPFAFLYGFPTTVPWLNPVFEAGVIVGGVVSTVLGDTLFVYSISKLGASLAIPITYLFVIWSALVDYQSGRVGAVVLVSAGIAVAGVWLAFSGSGRRDKAGLVAAIATSLVWTASLYGYDYALRVTRDSTGLDPVAASIVIGEVRSLYSLVVMAPFLSPTLIRGVLGEAFLSSIAGYVIGAYSFVAALGFLAPSIVSIGLALTPLTTQVMASRIASEALNKRMVAGASLVALSITLTTIAG